MNNTQAVHTPKTVLIKQATTKIMICKYLEQGLFFKDACVSSGITEQTGYNWKRQDFSFFSQCEAAIVKYKEKLIKCVNAGAMKDGRIALEVLKIRWPNEWNPKRNIISYNPEEELNRIHNMIYGHRCPKE